MALSIYQVYLDVRRQIFADAKEEMVLLLEASVAVRELVAQEIRPKLLPLLAEGRELPFATFSSTVAFAHWAELLREGLPQYSIHIFAPNPMDPKHAPQEWEKPILEEARGRKEPFERRILIPTQVEVKEMAERLGEVKVRRENRLIPYLYTFTPVYMRQECLLCHSSPLSAPAQVRAAYPGPSGYGWQVGELVGVLAVGVPLEKVEAVAKARAFSTIGLLLVLFLSTSLALYILLGRLVLSPLRLATERALALSRGERMDEPLPEGPKDEVGQLLRALELLRRSLQLLRE
ncbi:MAG: Tll0287-like domain-containing protein [Thermaceae bacterium]